MLRTETTKPRHSDEKFHAGFQLSSPIFLKTDMNKKQRRMKRKHRRRQTSPAIRQHGGHAAGSFRPFTFEHVRPGNQQAIPLWTRTGELVQPVRIYYHVHNPKKLRKRLNALACLRPSSDQQRWTWLYAGKASRLTFAKTPPDNGTPVELGAFSFRNETEIFLDVHSIERAVTAMAFWNRQLPRRAAGMTHVSIANDLCDPARMHAFEFPYCPHSEARADDALMLLFRTLDRLHTRRHPFKEHRATIRAYLRTLPASPFPAIEHLALTFSRKRSRQIQFAFESRQFVAIQRWKGNVSISPANYAALLLQKEPFHAITRQRTA